MSTPTDHPLGLDPLGPITAPKERVIVLREEPAVEAPDTQDLIREVCDELADFLVEKNRKYGDSAVNPVRLLSKSSPQEQLLVRMDDKLNRLLNGDHAIEDEDVMHDLVGYWVLLEVVKKRSGE